jgi:hypothetical protein
MAAYENCEGYEPYVEVTPDGKPKHWGMFGYPAEMLHLAVNRDDVKGFRFYFDRYFNLNCEVWNQKWQTSLVEYAQNAGAKKVAAELKRMAALKLSQGPSTGVKAA